MCAIEICNLSWWYMVEHKNYSSKAWHDTFLFLLSRSLNLGDLPQKDGNKKIPKFSFRPLFLLFSENSPCLLATLKITFICIVKQTFNRVHRKHSPIKYLSLLKAEFNSQLGCLCFLKNFRYTIKLITWNGFWKVKTYKDSIIVVISNIKNQFFFW